MPPDYDLIIIGAGLTGAGLAAALADSGLRIGIVEPAPPGSRPQSDDDERGIALAPASRQILEDIGVWPRISAGVTPIRQVHVSEQGRFGVTRLHARALGRTELACVALARNLGHALHAELAAAENIDLICPAELLQFQPDDNGMRLEIKTAQGQRRMTARLLAGCDGRHSLVRRLAGINTREHDFMQTAIVASLTTQKPNNGVAFERFTPYGPLALLPVGRHKSVLVFSVARADAERYLAKPEREFIRAVEAGFGRRLGGITRLGARRAWPLVFIEAARQHQGRLVLLGNAARTLHPNGAQGFNLGLRDVAGLADCLLNARRLGRPLDDMTLLEDYCRRRRRDQKRIVRFTNALAACFYNRLPILSASRGLGLLLLDFMPDLKRGLMEMAMGLSAGPPQTAADLRACAD